MAIYYSYMLSLLFLLLITHSINTASLHFPVYSSQNRRNFSIMKSDYTKSESMHPQLPLVKRLRRWTINGDNDEVEIPFDQPILSVNNSDEDSSLHTLVNSTVLNLKTMDLNSSITEHFDEFINSTMALEIPLYENTTMKYPLLRQDLTELNQTDDQTTISMIDEVLQDNKTNIIFSSTIFNEFIPISSTISETLATNMTDINPVESVTDRIDNQTNEVESSSVPIILTQITDHIEPMFSNATEDNQTLNDSSQITISNESIINSNISQKDAIITIDQEISLNDTGIILIETIQNSTESSFVSSKSSTIPICDSSCLCSKECPYGFEILNDTCLCDPPCKSYQCFGNDTCIVTDKGQPLCQRENGTEYDRPTRCYQPRDAGYHDINMRYHSRWYYNPDQDTCHLFVYRGLGGNENNFRTLHECHSECITCAPLPDPGECLGRINMWYYDNKKSECREFEYSGCKGNDNKFLKREQCIDTCINRTYNLK